MKVATATKLLDRRGDAGNIPLRLITRRFPLGSNWRYTGVTRTPDCVLAAHLESAGGARERKTSAFWRVRAFALG